MDERFQAIIFFKMYSMKMNLYNLLGKILGLSFAVVFIKMLLDPGDRWWEIIEQMVKGMASP